MQRRSEVSAFTLVELLVVIAILAMLASMMLFALAGAEGDAKVMRTRSTISKLDLIIMRKWEEYRTRRVPLPSPVSKTRPKDRALQRLNAIRELQRMEMPDRLSDITDAPVVLQSVPANCLAYRRSLATATEQYQGAECLFLIVTKGCDDPDVMEQFGPQEIGDKDGDGLKEFWDAWQNPISFLRWAPGHNSNLQKVTAPIETHDQFDPMRLHVPTNTSDPWYLPPVTPSTKPSGSHPALMPLIYSSGADGIFDIVTDSSSTSLRYASLTPPNDPYFYDSIRIGTPSDLDGNGEIDTLDNITNHD